MHAMFYSIQWGHFGQIGIERNLHSRETLILLF